MYATLPTPRPKSSLTPHQLIPNSYPTPSPAPPQLHNPTPPQLLTNAYLTPQPNSDPTPHQLIPNSSLSSSQLIPSSSPPPFRGSFEVAAQLDFAPNITLVNSPFMVQHHPWFARRHGAFSNASIILHELKNPNSPGWAFAAVQGRGPFEPYSRVCDSCRAMGWSTDLGSPFGAWQCCGTRWGK